MTTLAEYRTRLDTEPLTGNQLGRIHAEFYRLGFHVTADRAERLRLTATLARVPGPLASTKDLTMGEAGRAVGALAGCRTVPELYALAVPEPAPAAPVPAMTIGQAVIAFAVALEIARRIAPARESRDVRDTR